MPPKSAATHPFDTLIQRAAAILADRLTGVLARPADGARTANKRRSTALKGIKRDMSCRVEGCKNRSGGPYWGYICDEHRRKLGKKEQQAARDAWKAKHGEAA